MFLARRVYSVVWKASGVNVCAVTSCQVDDYVIFCPWFGERAQTYTHRTCQCVRVYECLFGI